jgi:hypothetical protein
VRLLAAIRRFVFGPKGPPPRAADAFSAVRDIEQFGHDFEEWQVEPASGDRKRLDAEVPWELRDDPEDPAPQKSRP